MKYLECLNEAQKRAVLAVDGPVSVLAGAGSGKTRVLTTRIYHLIREGVPAGQILAVTFTNKAAREMCSRVRTMLGEEISVPFIATFHGLGRELLESYGKAIGIPRFFSVYDRDDSEKAIAAALKALDVGAKEHSPRAVLGRISREKGKGMRAREFHEKHAKSGFGARIVAEAWLRYEKTLQEEKALDFDDLIALPVRLLEEHDDIRALAQDRWKYIHIDEYQDTNALQGRLANMLAAKHGNLFVVGDIDQCLVAGTDISLPEGMRRPIEEIKKGDLVLSNYGSGDVRPSRVTRIFSRKTSGELIRIITKNGREITSTKEHMHFAGYQLDTTPLKEYPHHRAQATRSNRRNIVVALCGEHRGKSPMHRISMVGSDAEGGKLLQAAGFSVRPAKKGSKSWRFETAYKNYGYLLDVVRHLQKIFPTAYLVQTARLGGKKIRPKDGNSLPFLPAASIRSGMALFDEKGGFDVVEKIARIPVENTRVYDLDIEHTHNFIANGIVTHNCIYTWRGASVENLLEFDTKYPGAQTIILERNYRSTKNLVDAANAVIERNKNRKEKYSTTEKAAGEPILVHSARSAEDEARWIALKIRALMRNGTNPEEIAILFRTNFQSRALEEGLLRAGVPYRLLGTRFFARKEVKDALAWMRLAMDSSREVDKLRAAASPPRGIGKVTLAKLAAGQRSELRAGELAKVEQFERVIDELSQAALALIPSEFVKLVVEKSGMRRALYEEGSEEDRERFENVEELASVAARHDALLGKEGIAAFLAEAALASDQDEMDHPSTRSGQGAEKTGVTLMTVHAAKGLEFNTVFVSGMEEGLFPHQGMGGENDRDEEEERRLFYVAMTRAKERLILTLARVRKIYGSDFASEPSSFLADIDPSLMLYDETDGEKIIEA